MVMNDIRGLPIAGSPYYIAENNMEILHVDNVKDMV